MKDQTDLLTSFTTSLLTRRQIIAGSAVGLCGMAMVATRSGAQEAAGSQKSKTILTTRAIHHEEDFTAAPQRIYEALLDAKQFSAMTASPGSEINREVGGTFAIFGGHIIGRQLQLTPNRLIVQAWRVVDWAEGIYSIARFELSGQGPGTRLKFDHTGFPPELAEHLEDGWREHYWSTLRKYLT
jgi:activator of HSP90 ATPase